MRTSRSTNGDTAVTSSQFGSRSELVDVESSSSSTVNRDQALDRSSAHDEGVALKNSFDQRAVVARLRGRKL
jgi:hypothetical protein